MSVTLEIAKILYPGKELIFKSYMEVDIKIQSLPLEDLILTYKPLSDDLRGRSQLIGLTMDLLIVNKGKLKLKTRNKSREDYAKHICELWLENHNQLASGLNSAAPSPPKPPPPRSVKGAIQ